MTSLLTLLSNRPSACLNLFSVIFARNSSAIFLAFTRRSTLCSVLFWNCFLEVLTNPYSCFSIYTDSLLAELENTTAKLYAQSQVSQEPDSPNVVELDVVPSQENNNNSEDMDQVIRVYTFRDECLTNQRLRS